MSEPVSLELILVDTESPVLLTLEEIEATLIVPSIAVTGPRGPRGYAATIEVGTVTTGDEGTDAEITNSGTENAAVFNFVIPRGDKGDKGDPGESMLINYEVIITQETIIENIVPVGYQLNEIAIYNQGESACEFYMGITQGGKELYEGGIDKKAVETYIYNRIYSMESDTSIYINSPDFQQTSLRVFIQVQAIFPLV